MENKLLISCLMVLIGYSSTIILKEAPIEAPVSAIMEQTEETVEVTGPAPSPEPSDPEPVLSECDMVKMEISKYDWDTNVMLAIAKAESNCKLEAVGDKTLTYTQNGRTYGYSVGPFQIRIMQGREWCDTFDLATNVSCAYNIYKGQGLRAWTVYKTGKYLEFL